MDETPLEVMRVNEQEVREEYRDEDRHRKKETEKTETQKKCCMWVVRGGEEMHPVHLYNFKWTRSGKNVLEFLDGFEGCVLHLTDTPGMILPLISGTKIILNINLPTQIVIIGLAPCDVSERNLVDNPL